MCSNYEYQLTRAANESEVINALDDLKQLDMKQDIDGNDVVLNAAIIDSISSSTSSSNSNVKGRNLFCC